MIGLGGTSGKTGLTERLERRQILTWKVKLKVRKDTWQDEAKESLL